MATPIVVNPTNPSQVVINSGSGHSGIVVVPSDKETIRLENPKYSGIPIQIDDSIDWGRIKTIATEAVVDLIIPIDDKLSTTSENAVQNKVLTNEIESLKEENSRLNDKVATLGKLAAAGIVL